MDEAKDTTRAPIAAKAWLWLVIAIALLTLVFGWGLGNSFFIRIQPQFASMVPSTAIGFILLGAGLLAVSRPSPSKTAQSWLVIAAGLVAAIAVADLVVLISGKANGVDSLLWPELLRRPGDGMAAATATSFLLASIACLDLRPGGQAGGLSIAAATLGLILCSVALVAYALDSKALYGVFLFTAMALHTAIAFAMLFLALMLMSPGRGWIWLLLEDKAGSVGARRLIPFILVGPLLLCVLALTATRTGLFSANFRLSILAIAMMLIGTVAVLRNAALENRAEQRMKGLMADLESALADRSLLLREVYHRVKNNLQQINALLAIERGKVDDEQAREGFQAMSGRVQALGMVHQLLVQSSRPSQVDLNEFLEKLCDSLIAGHGLTHREIDLSVRAAPDTVHLDIAMTIGLLTNELVANAIEHAFPPHGKGRIEVVYDEGAPGMKRLSIRDDGKGYDAGGEEGTGTLIVRSLVRQLRGELAVRSEQGTVVSIDFPANLSEEIRYVDN